MTNRDSAGDARGSGTIEEDMEPSTVVAGVPDEAFHRLARLAARVVGAPIALVSVLDGGRLRAKGAVGMPEGVLSSDGVVPRDLRLCLDLVASGEPVVIRDARRDDRLKDLPVVAKHGIAACLGTPLRSVTGTVVGVLAFLDLRSRPWTEEEQALGRDLAASAEAELEWRAELVRRMEAERSLRERESHFRALVENAPDAVLVLDEDGRVIYHTPALERITGWSEEMLRRKGPFERTHPDDEAGVRAVYRLLLAEPGETVRTEFRARHGNGDWIVLEATATNRVDDPAVGGVVVNARDVTERKRAEEATARFHELLEATPDFVAIADAEGNVLYRNPAGFRMLGRPETSSCEGETLHDPDLQPDWAHAVIQEEAVPVAIAQGYWSGESAFLDAEGREIPVSQVVTAHRSADGDTRHFSTIARDLRPQRALEQRLLQAQKLEAVGRLAGGVAHDFNNMLTAITGYATLMQAYVEDDPEAMEVLDEILNAARRSTELTRQLLAFSRKQILKPERLELNGVVQGVQNMLQRLIGENIDLDVSLQTPLPTVEVDRAQIEQVIVNLAVNARDAMPHGGRLRISTRAVEVAGDEPEGDGGPAAHDGIPRGRFVCLLIRDTGVGMDPETRDHVFEPFFTTKAVGKGTGLGLATVHGIVEQSGGFTRVESSPGEGTTFYIFLPQREPGNGGASAAAR